ncbi:MAG: YitT family protein [Clostridia bacterium]|nr:YitT family protein [Clostridia bacterium]
MNAKVRHSAKEVMLDFIFMLVGSIIYSVGINGFTAPNNIAPGGVTGVATMLNYLLDTPIGTVVFLINIPIIAWAVIEIGYKLVAKTMLAIVLNSVAIDMLAAFVPAYHGDALIITLIGGVCEGVGLGLVFVRGATTGGTDMIARLLNRRLRHLSMGKLMLAVDGCIILISAFVFQSMESAVYACIVVFVSTNIIDAILYGVDSGNGKMFFVISQKNEEIAEKILYEMDRGVTFLKSRGGYMKREGEMLLCAVRRFEVFRISEIIRKTDPDAFVIVGDAGEITGEGFKSSRSDDRTLKDILRNIRRIDDSKPENTTDKEKADGE